MNGEGRPGGTTPETANQPAKAATSLAQLPPVGPHATAATLLLGALVWATPDEAADVLDVVRDDDMPTPAASVVLAAVRRRLSAGRLAAPALTLDELRADNSGRFDRLAALELQNAVTSGAAVPAMRDYAAATLADSLRRRVENTGTAMTSAAQVASEQELTALVSRAMVSCLDCAGRLQHLRGDTE